MSEESLNDEEEREFDLMEDDEPEQPHIHHGIEIVDLEAQDEATNENITIREKDAQVQELMDNLVRAKYVISSLDQENKQLSDKQVLLELEHLKAKRQGDTGKSVMQEEETPTTLTSKQRIEKEIEEDRETWLDRVNFHLEKLLQKSNRDNQIIRHMAHHYRTWNKICNIRIKQMKTRLKQELKGKREGDRLRFLAEASLVNQDTLWWCSPQILSKF